MSACYTLSCPTDTLLNKQVHRDEASSSVVVSAPQVFAAHASPLTAVTFSPSGRRLVTCDGAGVVLLWSNLAAPVTEAWSAAPDVAPASGARIFDSAGNAGAGGLGFTDADSYSGVDRDISGVTVAAEDGAATEAELLELLRCAADFDRRGEVEYIGELDGANVRGVSSGDGGGSFLGGEDGGGGGRLYVGQTGGDGGGGAGGGAGGVAGGGGGEFRPMLTPPGGAGKTLDRAAEQEYVGMLNQTPLPQLSNFPTKLDKRRWNEYSAAEARAVVDAEMQQRGRRSEGNGPALRAETLVSLQTAMAQVAATVGEDGDARNEAAKSSPALASKSGDYGSDVVEPTQRTSSLLPVPVVGTSEAGDSDSLEEERAEREASPGPPLPSLLPGCPSPAFHHRGASDGLARSFGFSDCSSGCSSRGSSDIQARDEDGDDRQAAHGYHHKTTSTTSAAIAGELVAGVPNAATGKRVPDGVDSIGHRGRTSNGAAAPTAIPSIVGGGNPGSVWMTDEDLHAKELATLGRERVPDQRSAVSCVWWHPPSGTLVYKQGRELFVEDLSSCSRRSLYSPTMREEQQHAERTVVDAAAAEGYAGRSMESGQRPAVERGQRCRDEDVIAVSPGGGCIARGLKHAGYGSLATMSLGRRRGRGGMSGALRDSRDCRGSACSEWRCAKGLCV